MAVNDAAGGILVPQVSGARDFLMNRVVAPDESPKNPITMTPGEGMGDVFSAPFAGAKEFDTRRPRTSIQTGNNRGMSQKQLANIS